MLYPIVWAFIASFKNIKLVDMVKLHKIDVLHVHYAIPHAYAGYMAKKMLEDEGIFIPMITTLKK